MNKNCEIELKHIQLELEYGRAQHLRHFCDQYFCYKNNYLNGNNNAAWEKILWSEIVSLEAKVLRKQIIDAKQLRKAVVKEHVVPLRIVTEELIKLKNINLSNIAEILDKLMIFATITKVEDKKLRDLKLSSKMPKEYNNSEHQWYQDPFARYKSAEIKYERIQKN